MEKMRIVGTRDVDFTDKETNRRIQGTSIYVTHPEDGVAGQIAEKLFLNPDVLFKCSYKPTPGDDIAITWGRKNRIDSIEKVAK